MTYAGLESIFRFKISPKESHHNWTELSQFKRGIVLTKTQQLVKDGFLSMYVQMCEFESGDIDRCDRPIYTVFLSDPNHVL